MECFMKKIVFGLIALSMMVTSASAFKRGNTVYLYMSNGTCCKAIFLMRGDDESKVELRESCTVALFTMKSSGEKIWAPNSAIMRNSSSCN